ncbi:MAG TPA: hypothetical protein PL018_01840 [Ignavibacteriaceae bacterium]|nr:hypothetical protein [Ignavibacteriaceae bacterium]HRQ52970.1 hypothetical protein [Ignavibacteriaceae bacterium]
MKSIKYLYIILLLCCLWLDKAAAQNDYNSIIVTDTIAINFQNYYPISSVNIIPGSEIIFIKSKQLNSYDYSFTYSKTFFTLSDSLPYSIFDTLIVTYRSFKLSLQKEYQKRSLVVKYDEKFGDTVSVLTSTSGFSPESIFGADMQKSGTIVRGFTVGTTKDFSLTSGLRLQLSGRIAEDIEIVAALTDENTPIQPEGNTERLEELDKVFIQVKHPNVTGTFGDYQVKQKIGEFGVIDRKLQGLMGEFNFEDVNGYVSIANSRGKFNSNNFNGADGVQGPYRLSGLNNERDIIIIAGTEKVFLDGVELKRGENNDYTVEYSNATITFTPNRLITSASRINVDFEYTDRQFARSFFGAGTSAKLFNDKLNLKVQYMREGDDQDSPIDISLSEEDKNTLSLAGDDRNKAIKSGVKLAVPDSLGIIKGIYTKVDTTFNGEAFSYYVYNPGDSLSLYTVSFSYVGEGKGDYTRQSLGYYNFVGIGKGSYLPILFLPLPQLKQMGNIVVDVNPFENVTLSLEYAGSLWDKNRLSTLDDGDNYGYARNISLKVAPSQILIGDLDFGKAGLTFRDRFIQGKFTSLDRFDDVEFNRNYNSANQTVPKDETLREIGVTLQPIQELTINSTVGFLRKGDDFSSDRYNNLLRFSDSKTFSVDYNLDYVKSTNITLKSNWLRHKGNAFYTFWQLKPGMEFLAEDKQDNQTQKDSLLSSSLKYFEYSPYLELLEISGFKMLTKYSMRDDYLPQNGVMIQESNSKTYSLEMNYSGVREVNTNLVLTFRNKTYTEDFKLKGFLDNETILIRSRTKFGFWDRLLNGDLYYEVSTQKSAKLQKVFVRVEQGTGNYIYLGDLNNNGIADENEFEPTLFDGDYIQVTLPTDELFPVIDLKTSTRWKINFSELVDVKTLIGKIVSPISSETYWRIEENSRETAYGNIYLLKLSTFQNQNTTIRGSNYLQQDFFLFENDQELSFRFRFTQRTALNEFSSGYERYYNRERSLRIKFKMIKEISNQTDLVNQIDNVSAPINSNRIRQINSNNVISEFSYRPDKNIEVGFRIKAGTSEDTYPATPTIINLNSQLIRFNLSFLGTGRLRIEIERNELNANTSENVIPYELTNGNQIGKNYFWRLNFDYKLSSFLQTTISYDGRVQGANKVIHTARAEARAYF